MKEEEKINTAFGPGLQRPIGLFHRKTADWLNRHCKKLSPHMLMAIFILFCIMTGLYCMYLIFGILN
ncbi:hypothetical protein [Pedobacter mucosus]|uniref:hypothetical protein n=1 Tax=Pedobacter mucosus TaxID=2895286 RepID=UPI001EE3F05D|nr:hypothetical protein [Pedobacter mucosus]UKT65073.1 hypothetical protein LOK61_04675 [Pedobacter mucosus]